MKIYIVGDRGPEHNTIVSGHKTYDGALKAWNVHRLMLLKDVQDSLSQYENKELLDPLRKMYIKMINNLKEQDITKIDCYPHETPYILEMELEE